MIPFIIFLLKHFIAFEIYTIPNNRNFYTFQFFVRKQKKQLFEKNCCLQKNSIKIIEKINDRFFRATGDCNVALLWFVDLISRIKYTSRWTDSLRSVYKSWNGRGIKFHPSQQLHSGSREYDNYCLFNKSKSI